LLFSLGAALLKLGLIRADMFFMTTYRFEAVYFSYEQALELPFGVPCCRSDIRLVGASSSEETLGVEGWALDGKEEMTTTRADMDGFATRLGQDLGKRFYVEPSSSGYSLYEELDPGAHEVLFGRTKGELWDLMHAFAEGVRYADSVQS